MKTTYSANSSTDSPRSPDGDLFESVDLFAGGMKSGEMFVMFASSRTGKTHALDANYTKGDIIDTHA